MEHKTVKTIVRGAVVIAFIIACIFPSFQHFLVDQVIPAIIVLVFIIIGLLCL